MSEHPTSTNKPKETADSSGYVVVARRYRPRNFEELVGQQHVGQALRNAIETNRVGHAYLFTGARGVGKTSTARIFAKSLSAASLFNLWISFCFASDLELSTSIMMYGSDPSAVPPVCRSDTSILIVILNCPLKFCKRPLRWVSKGFKLDPMSMG